MNMLHTIKTRTCNKTYFKQPKLALKHTVFDKDYLANNISWGVFG